LWTTKTWSSGDVEPPVAPVPNDAQPSPVGSVCRAIARVKSLAIAVWSDAAAGVTVAAEATGTATAALLPPMSRGLAWSLRVARKAHSCPNVPLRGAPVNASEHAG
jgi:hypothetical protein